MNEKFFDLAELVGAMEHLVNLTEGKMDEAIDKASKCEGPEQYAWTHLAESFEQTLKKHKKLLHKLDLAWDTHSRVKTIMS